MIYTSALRSYNEKSASESCFKLNYSVGNSLWRSVKGLNVEVHSIEVETLHDATKRTHKFVYARRGGENEFPIAVLSSNRDEHLLSACLPGVKGNLREVSLVHFDTTVGLSVGEGEDDDRGCRVNVIGIRLSAIVTPEAAVENRKHLTRVTRATR